MNIKKIVILLGLFFISCQQSPEKKTSDSSAKVVTGAQHLVNNNFDILEGKNVGLVTNHSAIVGDSLLIDLLHHAENVELKALFSPEHGIRGQADAGAHIKNSTDQETGLPIYSLYGNTRKPTPEMLEGIDVLVFDIQDVGARFYTYIATMGYTMQAAAEQGIPYVVLDRPNPLGGAKVEGFTPPQDYKSFKGLYPIPVTHGMTVGEFAKMVKDESFIGGLSNLNLKVVEMKGWNRNMLWPETGLPWKAPSPNIPDFKTALIYPGACLFEATWMSEGRGTEEPFIILGAPWADGDSLAKRLNRKQLPGLRFSAATFTPRSIEGMSTKPKLEGKKLKGIRYHITQADSVNPFAAGIHVLSAFYRSAPDSAKVNFFRPSRLNTLAGSGQFHDWITAGQSAQAIVNESQEEADVFKEKRKQYLLYD
ncbi:exo-beta-N-acetylmuramidase NamZ family protein [Fodinibius salsisoli]|uniref:DUF1343 domain-containing protein n=1 Tax=Fodinibius salsisoli TaxID=2820877 RepID=A0ABT3PKK4_9BACT|nr:DUF1343 domain-containing protein [Fodinibius salsisoli]MCW9706474.1 DUF1343 domain-containing protein [Fodinibius salsisoli]